MQKFHKKNTETETFSCNPNMPLFFFLHKCSLQLKIYMKVYLPIHTFVVIVVYFWKLKFLHEGILFIYTSILPLLKKITEAFGKEAQRRAGF